MSKSIGPTARPNLQDAELAKRIRACTTNNPSTARAIYRYKREVINILKSD